jgi:hypothetical protein
VRVLTRAIDLPVFPLFVREDTVDVAEISLPSDIHLRTASSGDRVVHLRALRHPVGVCPLESNVAW